jgi:predicted nucleotidyltransferase
MKIAADKIVFSGLAGSRLYGVANANSDTDIKCVFAHSLDGLILNEKDTDRIKDPSVNSETEWFSIRKFSSLLAQNQTVAIELLFIPQSHIITTSAAWEELLENRDKIISKNIMPFVGYARNQARLYSVKGDRLEFLHEIKKLVEQFKKTCVALEPTCIGITEYLNTFDILDTWIDKDFISFETRKTPNGKDNKMVMILGRGFEEFCTPDLWLERIETQINKYGERAEMAEENKGHDLKATYHAVRIIQEAMDLLDTGILEFPRPEAQLLREIRNGKYDYRYTCDLIQAMTKELEIKMTASTLRETPDKNWLTSWALRYQRAYVVDDFEVIAKIN